jgi:ketosteroid isomerase-like protein
MTRQTLLEYFRAVDSHDIPGLLATFHPDIVYERPGYEPFVGLERLRRFYEEERVLDSGGHLVGHIVIDGDAGAAEGRYVGTRRDGSPVDVRWADFYTFADGKIKTRRSYFFLPAV